MEIVIPVIIVGIIGFIAGLGLSLASKFMSVPTDEKQQKIKSSSKKIKMKLMWVEKWKKDRFKEKLK